MFISYACRWLASVFALLLIHAAEPSPCFAQDKPTPQTQAVPMRDGTKLATDVYSSDCPDTDFTVKLCDVYADGKSMLVTDGIQRASLRNSLEKREPLEPGKVYELEVDLWSTSPVFNKGHRVRVVVSSSNSPRFEPNPNTGEPHLAPGKTRVATNTLHVSSKYPSHILLPLYNGPDAVTGKSSEKPDRD